MLRLLQERFCKSRMKVSVPLAVVMLARRPYPVIGGGGSVYELCPYVVELQGRDDLSDRSPKIVRPAMHREDISDGLMRLASGDEVSERPAPWSLIGCGSVGSKLALHMARGGRGPTSIIDCANMLPHNYARHGVYPVGASKNYGLIDAKTTLLKSALSDLGGAPNDHALDVVNHLLAKRSLDTVIDRDCFTIVNTTGSATVRETLGSAAYSGERPRIVEACLLGAGTAGLMSVEGVGANPSTTDLICEAYLAIHRKPELAGQVFNTEAAEVAVGQGCSALTMPLRDSRLSLFAAAFGEKLYHLQKHGLPSDAGLLLLGNIGTDGLSQSWTETKIGPRTVVSGGSTEIASVPASTGLSSKRFRESPTRKQAGSSSAAIAT